MTNLEWQIEHARKKLAEYSATKASIEVSGVSEDNVFHRYGYLMALLGDLVKDYDAERAQAGAR